MPATIISIAHGAESLPARQLNTPGVPDSIMPYRILTYRGCHPRLLRPGIPGLDNLSVALLQKSLSQSALGQATNRGFIGVI